MSAFKDLIYHAWQQPMQVDTCFQAKYGNHGRGCRFQVDIDFLFPFYEFQSYSL